MWFLVILLVGTGEPPPYCNKNTLGKIESKFGIGRPPPPQLGQKTKFFQWFDLRAPLNHAKVIKYKCSMPRISDGTAFALESGFKVHVTQHTYIYLIFHHTVEVFYKTYTNIAGVLWPPNWVPFLEGSTTQPRSWEEAFAWRFGIQGHYQKTYTNTG